MRRTTLTILFSFLLLASFSSIPPKAEAQAVTFTSTLHVGSHGTQVTALQELLSSMQYLSVNASGYFGRLTQTAVMNFQTAYGLEPVGYTGVKTRAVLNGIIAGTTQRILFGTTPTPAPLPTPVHTVTPTMTFTSSASTVLSGGSVTLTWSSSNMSSCTASGGWSQSKPVSGSQVLSQLVTDQTYTLSCTGTDGSTQQQTLAIKIGTPLPNPNVLPPTVTLSTSATSVVSGGNATLTWSSANTTSCSAGGGWSGTKELSGAKVLSPLTTSQTYSLLCIGSDGSQVVKTISINVTPVVTVAPTLTLSTSASSVTAGGSATLTWTSTNTASCVASGGWSQTKALSGTQVLSQLTTSQQYALTCTGTDGSQISKIVSVTVTPVVAQVPTVTLSSSASSVSTGGNTTLTWTASDGSCVASGGWSGTQALTGSTLIQNITANQTYTLSCTNAAGTISKSASVAVVTQTPAPTPTPIPAPTPSGTGTVVHNATELGAALSALNGVGGATILLAPGNYGDVTLGQWNVGYNFPTTVTITSQDPSNRAVFSTLFLQNNNGIKLANFNVVAPSSVLAIRLNVNTNITVGGIKVTCPDRTGTGISSRADSGILITNNDVGNCATAISAYQDSGAITITRNNAHDVESDAIDIYSNTSSSPAPATVIVSENYIHDFAPYGADHPDGIQFTAFGASVTPTVTNNLITRGFFAGGVWPPQGVFMSDGPGYSNPNVSGNLLIGTLYNGITVADAVGGTINNNTVISFPDFGSWIRYEDDANLSISNNVSSSLVSVYPTSNTNITFSNNTYTSGVADMNAATPIIANWRATHPYVPSESTSPVVAMTGVAHGTVAGASTAMVFTKTLATGSTGAEVTALQTLMSKLGYLHADSITGSYGPLTTQAVMAFQKARGLEATGTVGPLTRAVLNIIVAGK